VDCTLLDSPPGLDETKFAVIAKIVAHEGRRDDLMNALRTMLPIVQAEVGTELYILNESSSDTTTVFVYELYRNEAAYWTHRQSDAHAHLRLQQVDLLAAPPEVSYARATDAKITVPGRGEIFPA
jgi:quinol monooxygenase YgiN